MCWRQIFISKSCEAQQQDALFWAVAVGFLQDTTTLHEDAIAFVKTRMVCLILAKFSHGNFKLLKLVEILKS